MTDKEYIIGFDEVGRGALAGPVVVAAVALPKNLSSRFYKNPQANPRIKRSCILKQKSISLWKRGKIRLKDSKKLNARQRTYFESRLKENNSVFFAISRVSNKIIDRINISNAANLAAFKSFKKVKAKLGNNANLSIILDGGLYLKNKKYSLKIAKTIVKADEKFNAVKLASIIAKLNRDRIMVRMAKTYPQYEFEVHNGYGVKRHLAAIKKYGKSDFHRLTFY
ncbi:MAG: ribonuclease HII [Patescibacteria group bacterium]|nr:ribonuclease HII [Patescibacteria group bacterium]